MAKTGPQMELTSASRQEMTLEQFGLASGAVSTMWFGRSVMPSGNYLPEA